MSRVCWYWHKLSNFPVSYPAINRDGYFSGVYGLQIGRAFIGVIIGDTWKKCEATDDTE